MPNETSRFTEPTQNFGRIVHWATSDVDKLFALADKQLGHIASSSTPRALAKSTEYSRFTRDMQVKTGLKAMGSIGRFVGRGGANTRSLKNRTGTIIYSDRGPFTTIYFLSALPVRSLGFFSVSWSIIIKKEKREKRKRREKRRRREKRCFSPSSLALEVASL